MRVTGRQATLTSTASASKSSHRNCSQWLATPNCRSHACSFQAQQVCCHSFIICIDCRHIQLVQQSNSDVLHCSKVSAICSEKQWRWDYIGNFHGSNGFNEIPIGMGIGRRVSWEWEWEIGTAWWKWEGMKTLHFPIYHPQVADHQTLLMDLCFCIVIYRRLLG